MNTLTKQLIGAAIGGALGWFVGEVIVTLYQLQAEEETYEHEHDETNDQNAKFYYKPKSRETTTEMKKQRVVKPRDYSQHFSPEMKASLSQLTAKYRGELPEPEGREEVTVDGMSTDVMIEEEVEFSIEDDNPQIQIISAQQYAGSDSGYEQETLSYYEDDVLTDKDDEPVAKPEELVGEDALVSFDDEDVVYVRNNNLEIEYEIIRTNKNYGVAVDTKPQPRNRKELDEEDDES